MFVPPDKALVRDQLQSLQGILKAHGHAYFCSSLIWILTKQKQQFTNIEQTKLVPFNFNRGQADMEANLAKNNLLLKTRQEGGTTYFALRRLFLSAITEEGTNCLQISQSNEMVEKHFRIIRRAHRLIGAEDPRDDSKNDVCFALRAHLLHTSYSNRRELVFDQIDSSITVASAEVEEAGQGLTLSHILADEYARWPGDPEATLSNVRGALVPGGTVDKISTGNGQVGPFYRDALLAMDDPKQSDSRFHFHPWWWGEEYTEAVSQERAAEIIAELTEEEMSVIRQIHKDLKDIAWMPAKARSRVAGSEVEEQDDKAKIAPEDMVGVQYYLPRIAWRRGMKLEQRGNFDEKYPEDPITAFLALGRQYFDQQILVARKRELLGFVPAASWHNGEARLFHKRTPGRIYVIGADVATGREVASDETDSCAAVALDLETGEEMAAYRAKVTPQDFAFDLADLGRYYNDSWIAVERTGDGGTTILTLANDCKYNGIMKFREWWKRQRTKIVEVEGFPTTPKTRPIALNYLNEFVLNHPELIWDEQFINEALTFVRDEKGIPKATPGAHDDTVSARWIAHMARRYLLGWWDPLAATRRPGYISADRITGDTLGGLNVA